MKSIWTHQNGTRSLALTLILLMTFGLLPGRSVAAEEGTDAKTEAKTLVVTIETAPMVQTQAEPEKSDEDVPPAEAVTVGTSEAPADTGTGTDASPAAVEPAPTVIEPAPATAGTSPEGIGGTRTAADTSAVAGKAQKTGAPTESATGEKTVETGTPGSAAVGSTQEAQPAVSSAAAAPAVATLGLDENHDVTMKLQNALAITSLKIGDVYLVQNSAVTGNQVDGTSFDASTMTLTFDGLNQSASEVFADLTGNTLNLMLFGNNVIRNLLVKGSCIINGSGSLEAIDNNIDKAADHWGAIETSENLTINGGTIHAVARGDANHSILGIFSRGDITINGGTIDTLGETPTDTGNNVFGMDGNGQVVINGGSITASGIGYSAFGEGINGEEGLIINGGTVKAYGTSKSSERGFGLLSSNGKVALYGGDVTARGFGPDSHAILSALPFVIGKYMILREGDLSDVIVIADCHSTAGDVIHVADKIVAAPTPSTDQSSSANGSEKLVLLTPAMAAKRVRTDNWKGDYVSGTRSVVDNPATGIMQSDVLPPAVLALGLLLIAAGIGIAKKKIHGK